MENYERKYKEALEWMQSLYSGLHGATKEDAEHYFPELKESEDERIKREIIAYINELADLKNEKIPTNWLAWLERQEQESKKVSIWKHWKDGIAGNGEGRQVYLIRTGNTYNLSSVLSFECDYIELSELDNLMLEKQGEKVTNINAEDYGIDGLYHAIKILEGTVGKVTGYQQCNNKACEWLDENMNDVGIRFMRGDEIKDIVDLFRKAMKGD